jgi:hypothetical protein
LAETSLLCIGWLVLLLQFLAETSRQVSVSGSISGPRSRANRVVLGGFCVKDGCDAPACWQPRMGPAPAPATAPCQWRSGARADSSPPNPLRKARWCGRPGGGPIRGCQHLSPTQTLFTQQQSSTRSSRPRAWAGRTDPAPPGTAQVRRTALAKNPHHHQAGHRPSAANGAS